MPERLLAYSLAINEAIDQCMAADDNIILIGQGVKSPWYVGNTCKNLVEKYTENRVIDTPVSENAMTGAAVGAAIAGMKSIVVHPRADFCFYAFDPMLNQAANWHYMSGGNATVPVVIWLIVNRGGEQAAQHSQAIQAMLAHAPGLKVVAPSNAFDAKGIMVSAIKDKNPVVFIDDRWLYSQQCHVPEDIYEIPIGKGYIRREGKDITLISSSWMTAQCMKAIKELIPLGFDIEFIDLPTIKPLDTKLLIESANKTGKVLIIDGTWKSFGVSAEIAAVIAENATHNIRIERLALPDCPAPSSGDIENAYYPGVNEIFQKVKNFFTN